jgi:hypothetical protein
MNYFTKALIVATAAGAAVPSMAGDVSIQKRRPSWLPPEIIQQKSPAPPSSVYDRPERDWRNNPPTPQVDGVPPNQLYQPPPPAAPIKEQ